MMRQLLLVAMAVVAMSSQSFAGGGGKNNGTLVVTNATAPAVSVYIVIDPPPAWAAWEAPFTPAQGAELAKRATIITAAGSQSFSVKKGAHKVLAVNASVPGEETFTLTDVMIVKKKSTAISVNP